MHNSALVRRGKGMDGVKWVVDPSELDELPHPQEVSRVMLAAPDFNVESFLTSIANFRTLKEVKDAVAHWEHRLHDDLSQVVNDNFDDFVKSASSINSGIAPLESVHTNAVQYSASAQQQQLKLTEAADAIERELQEHKQLCVEEANALKVLYMLDLQQELEAAVAEFDGDDQETLVSLARSYVAMASIAEDMKRVKVVQINLVAMTSIGREVMGFLESAMKKADPSEKQPLEEALHYVNEAKI